MKSRVVVVMLVVLMTSGAAGLFAQESQSDHGRAEPPMAGVHWAKGQAPPTGSGKPSPNLYWHGGDIMTTADVTAIFWGPSWSSSTFAGDKVSGLDTFYSGMGNTNYATTS